jgi:hypothetical protein
MNNANVDRERLIDRFLSGHMDEAEVADFEAMMNDDDELREDVEFMEDIKASLVRRDSNLQKMQQWKAEVDQLENTVAATVRNTHGRVIVWKTMVSAAACVALCLGLYHPFSYNGLQDHDFMAMASRGSLDEVITLIENASYEQAMELIDDSIDELEATLPIVKNPDYVKGEIDYLQWARIQALLKQKDYERAFEEVDAFRTDISEYQKKSYQKKADRLYKKLKIRLRK